MRNTKIIQKWSNLRERCAMSWNERKIIFAISSFWVMVDFVGTQKASKNLQIFSTKTTIFHVNMITYEIKKKKWIHEFIYSDKKNWWEALPATGASPPTLPTGAAHIFGLRTLASLLSVWISFGKISSVFCIHEVIIKIDHI